MTTTISSSTSAASSLSEPKLAAAGPVASPAEELAKVAAEIQRDQPAVDPQAPGAVAGAPPDEGFQYVVATKGYVQVGINAYARARRRRYKISDEKATNVAKPLDTLVNRELSKYLPQWAKERPELVALVFAASEIALEIEASPRLEPEKEPPAGSARPPAPAPVIATPMNLDRGVRVAASGPIRIDESQRMPSAGSV